MSTLGFFSKYETKPISTTFDCVDIFSSQCKQYLLMTIDIANLPSKYISHCSDHTNIYGSDDGSLCIQ